MPAATVIPGSWEGKQPIRNENQGFGIPNRSANWFAIRVKHQFEISVASHLQTMGFRGLVPLCKQRRKWSDRVKVIEAPVFPGYVLGEFDRENRMPVDMIPGVYGIVKFGGRLAEVERREVESIQTVMDAGIETSPWSRFQPGHTVEIDYGPLRGVTGVVVQDAGECRIILSISLLNRSLAVRVDREWMRSVN